MNNKPIFFLHFPRTGGTTIDEIFASNLDHNEIIAIYSKSDYEQYSSVDTVYLENIKYITGHLLLENLTPPTFYGKEVNAFTFLRDPVKRLFSEYNFLKSWKHQHLYDYLNYNNINFSQYIKSTEKILLYRGKNFMTRCLSGDSLEKMTDISSSLEKAKYNLINNLWFFGIQERFIESILLLSEKSGLSNVLHQRHNSLKKLKSNNPEPTVEEIQIVNDYNWADIELYKFAADQFDRIVKSKGKLFQKKIQDFIFLNKKYQKLAGLLYKNAYNDENSVQEIDLPKEVKW